MFGLSRVVKRIEQEKTLDEISEPLSKWYSKLTGPDPVKYVLSGSWLGHQLHPMLTDLPIGAWVMASALDVTGGQKMQSASQRLVALGFLSAIPTVLTGVSDWSESYGKEQRVGMAHFLGNGWGIALQGLSWVARKNDRHKLGAGLSMLGLGFTTAAAYLGGHLTLNDGVGVNHTAFEQHTKKWTDVAAEDDVQEGQLVRVTANKTPVVLTRHKGELHALSATCAHAGGPLNKGHIEDDCIVCPWHQSKFRIADGVPMRGPAGSAQPSWDVRAQEGRVLVKAAD